MKAHSYVGKKEKPMKKLSHGYHGKQYCSWVFIGSQAQARKACCHVASAFLGRLELIWLISGLKISKMIKKLCLWQKARRVDGLTKVYIFLI